MHCLLQHLCMATPVPNNDAGHTETSPAVLPQRRADRDILEHNEQLLAQVLKELKHLRVIRLVSLTLTIFFFIIIPIVATIIVLPKAVRQANDIISATAGQKQNNSATLQDLLNTIQQQ